MLVSSAPFCPAEFILVRMRLIPVFRASLSASGKYGLFILQATGPDYIALKEGGGPAVSQVYLSG